MVRVPPTFFGGFYFFRWFRTTANMWHLGPQSGRLVGGSALKPGLPAAGADCRFSGRISAGNPLYNARSGRPQTRRRKLRKSGNPDFRIPSGCHMGGVYWIPAARFLTSPTRVLEGVSGENGARKSTGRAGRRGPAFGSRPAHKSPDFGPIRKSSVSGEIVGEIRKSGFRDPVRMS